MKKIIALILFMSLLCISCSSPNLIRSPSSEGGRTHGDGSIGNARWKPIQVFPRDLKIENGPVSAVCFTKDLKNTLLYDIYEGVSVFKYSYDKKISFEMVFNRIASVAPKFARLYSQSIHAIVENQKPFGYAFKGYCSRDSLDYDGLKNKLKEIGSSSLYSELDEINASAMFVHEAIYRVLHNKFGLTEAVLTRNLVAFLTSTNSFKNNNHVINVNDVNYKKIIEIENELKNEE